MTGGTSAVRGAEPYLSVHDYQPVAWRAIREVSPLPKGCGFRAAPVQWQRENRARSERDRQVRSVHGDAPRRRGSRTGQDDEMRRITGGWNPLLHDVPAGGIHAGVRKGPCSVNTAQRWTHGARGRRGRTATVSGLPTPRWTVTGSPRRWSTWRAGGTSHR